MIGVESHAEVYDRVVRRAARAKPSLDKCAAFAQRIAAAVVARVPSISVPGGVRLVDRTYGELSGLGTAAHEAAVAWPAALARHARAVVQQLLRVAVQPAWQPRGEP